MAAFLREFLVLDVNTRYPAALEFTHRTKNVELVAVAGIGVGDNRDLDCGRNAPETADAAALEESQGRGRERGSGGFGATKTR